MRPKLLTQEIRNKIPKLKTTENIADNDKVCIVKFFSNAGHSGFRWYAFEGEPVLNDNGEEIDFLFYGWVAGHEREWGYFSLAELAEVKIKNIIPAVERDQYWKSKTFREIKKDFNQYGYS